MRTLLFVISFIAPPITVGLYRGFGWSLVLNLVLCVLTLWIGAIVHALLVLALSSEVGRYPYLGHTVPA